MTKSRLRFAFVLGLLFTLTARAGDFLTPDEIVAESGVGKEQYVGVLRKMLAKLPTANEPQMLYDYIALLDALKRQGEIYGFKTPMESPLAETGLSLTRNAATLLRLDSDPWEFIKLYFRWSDDVTRAAAAQQQLAWAGPMQTKRELLFFHGRLAGSIDYLKELKALPYVSSSLADVDAVVLNKLLAVPEGLTKIEMDKVLAVTKTPSAIQYAFDYLEQQAVQAANGERSAQVLRWVLVLGNNLRAMGSEAPFSLKSYPGRLLGQCLSKALISGTTLSTDDVPVIIANLQTTQYAELGATLSELFRERAIPDTVLEFLYALSRETWRAQQSQGFLPPTRDFYRFLQRIAILNLMREHNFEGTYDVTVGGKQGRLTLANTGNGGLVAGLRIYFNAKYGTDFGFFHFLYDLDLQRFEMHRFETYPEQTYPMQQRNWELKFHLEPKNNGKDFEIVGKFNNGMGPQEIKGKRIARFPKLAPWKGPASEESPKLAGVWSGRAGGHDLVLTVSQDGHRLSAIAVIDHRVVEIPFPNGIANYKKGVLTLMTGELENGSYVQIRGRFAPDFRSFRGFYLIGGQGPAFEVTVQKR